MMARKSKTPEPAIAPLPLHVGDRDPTKPAYWEYADAIALRAVASGNADAGQQQRALKWIVKGAADGYGLSFRAGDPHATSFAEGKRHVALQIIKLCELSPEILGKVREREQAAQAATQQKDRT